AKDDRPVREVAVKVLRPGVEAAFALDLALFYDLAALAERTQPRLRRFRPTEVVALFDKTVRIEMDLRMEAAAASELAENFADDASYRVPGIDWERSSQRVLTMDRVAGIPIDDREALLAAGHDLEAVLTKAAAVFFNQVFRDGFFHGDQHPGNMWVDAAGNIVVVDFGIMGRLDRKTRSYLADMLLATLTRDYRRLAEVHAEAGYLPPEGELDVFAQALRSVCEPIFGRPLREISFARLLAQLLQLTEAFSMPVQPQLLLLQKNMLMAEGISRRLTADLNIWSLAQPLVEDWVIENRGPQARLRDSAEEAAHSLSRLPETLRDVRKAAHNLAEGAVRLHPESIAALRQEQVGNRWQTRLLWGLVGLLVLLLLLD
ncbi:MAG: AarF/UbiB family protein, partial [Kiloniellales bacterium]|nr:AarF/UbiB family protein [Kiloniellales bacterium]